MGSIFKFALLFAGSSLGRTVLIGLATAMISAGLGSLFTHKVVEGNEAALTRQLNDAKDQLATANEVNASNVKVIEEYARQKDIDDAIVADVQSKQAATEQSLNEARAEVAKSKTADELAGPDWDHLFTTITKGKADARPKTVPKPRAKPVARPAGITCHDPSGLVPCHY